MNKNTVIIIGLVLILLCTPLAWADDNANEFIAAVNQAWCSSNYVQLETIINTQLENTPDDLLALGLKFEYHYDIIVDYHKAYAAAQAYVIAVSNRMPSEIMNRRMPVNMALWYIESPTPTNFPPSTLKTQNQMDFLHKKYSTEIPDLWLYKSVPERIEQLETGLITDEDLSFFNEPSGLKNGL